MKRRKSKPAFPIYLCAGLWLLLGLICPGMLLNARGLAGAALLSAALYLGASRWRHGRRMRVYRRHA